MELIVSRAFPAPVRSLQIALLVLSAIALGPLGSAATHATPPPGSPCANIPHSDHPKAYLTNGTIDAQIFLPDVKDGYYRGSRFDWAGVVPCVSLKDHTFFGEWFQRYDPMIADAITGPVEEFTTSEGAIGYDRAKVGEPFVKIGVGVLRKTPDGPYRFMAPYPLIDGGKRRVKVRARSVVFTQRLKGPNGIAYRYTKTLRLDAHGAVLTIQHRLQNTGTAAIDTEVYDHDFYMLDHKTTGPGIVVHFPLEPKPAKPLGAFAEVQGHDLVFLKELGPRETVASFLTGYSNKVSDYDITVEDQSTGVGVEQTSDTPLSKVNFWSPRTTVCPEAYVHLIVPAGKTAHYAIHYRFFADKPGAQGN
jgi:hypothetical protein